MGRYLVSAAAAATEQVPRMNDPNLRPLNFISFDLSLAAAQQTLSFISLPMAPGGKHEDGQGPWTKEARAQFMK